MKLLLLAIAVSLLSAAAQVPGSRVGKRTYTEYGCYQCHGREGQGSPATGSRLGPNPIPLPAFMRYVRQPTGQMPPYTSRVLSDAQLEDIYAFLRSLPQPPPAKSIPLLN